ncbi:MAG: MoaD/ThiS family protein [Thermoanaerobaculia bacterium]
MKVRLLAFASAVAAIGSAEREWELASDLSVAELRQRLALDYPAIAPLLPRIAIAIDGALVHSSMVVRDGAEVALLPPVSGG